jgi:peptidoglycan/LPS O-acetylase OafA/YrhL
VELIAAIVFAGPLGYFARCRKQGLGLYLIAWAVIFPIQFVVVHHEKASDINPSYWVFNAVFLAAGIGLNTLGARLRERRRRTIAATTR